MNNQPPALATLNLPRPPWRVIGFAVLALVALIVIWSSFYTVPAESEAVVLRFGRFLRIAQPGLNFKIPLGVDDYTLVQTRRQLKLEFGFYTAGYTNVDQPSRDQVEEKSMVTGDLTPPLARPDRRKIDGDRPPQRRPRRMGCAISDLRSEGIFVRRS